MKVDARVKARAETLSGRKAFGDAENTDAESDSRRLYALQLRKVRSATKDTLARARTPCCVIFPRLRRI